MNDNEKQIEFLTVGSKVAEKIHEDGKKAKKLIEKLKDATNFASIIERRKKESENFLEETKAFARVIHSWSEDYVTVLEVFKDIMEYTIHEELEKIPGMHIRYDNRRINIDYDEKKFNLQFQTKFSNFEENKEIKWSQNGPSMKALAKKENKIAKEVAEVLTLDIHIEHYLAYIVKLNTKYRISKVAEEVEKTNSEISDELINNIHILTKWWSEVNDMLEYIKKYLHKAVEIDKKVAKHLDNLFTKEERAELKEKRLKATKNGLLALAKISTNIIPGLGVINMAFEGIDFGKEINKTIKDLKK